MAMALRIKFSYHRRLFLLLLTFSWTLVGCFTIFQYGREKHFRAEQFDARLQLLNINLFNELSKGVSLSEIAEHGVAEFPDLRISLIDSCGNVLFDNSMDVLPADSHLDRPEIIDAIANGRGYTIRRHSRSTDNTYFYSAMARDGLIVRCAVPYSLPLKEILSADMNFLWFMSVVALLMSVAAYFVTRRLGQNISRLNDFAGKVERGEDVSGQTPFPNDELGSISNHLIRLYARLQRASADRDREHAVALHQEREKIRIKKQLTNNINHELKTPVAAVQGYLETLLAHPELSEEKRKAFIVRGLSQCERLRRLMADVAVITRMDEGGRAILKERVVLNNIIDEIVTEMEGTLSSSGIRVENDITEEIVMLGNPSLLSSIFRNLMDNAVSYSGCDRIIIHLVDSTINEFTIVFADNGTGVPAEHLPHLFERFYRVDKGRSRKMGGTGLGLSIVKNAVLMHGGDIKVSNRVSGGLEFLITISKQS